ncbi:aldo/keto reductase [Gordonia sp. CPCC 205515]|uniref:aldo/keto reductase n=1 Tax=Gordonia sp. CPCC 205515 TaxID=3140791 RepID=UPI003AF35BC3
MTADVSTRLGLGLAALGRPAYITAGRDHDLAGRGVEQMRARTAEVLDAAYALGIRYVDTARSYGRAEEFLADWIAAHPEITDVTVASKWGYRYVGDWQLDAAVHEVKDHSLDAFTEQFDQSRALLGDRLGLYQVHSLTDDSPLWHDTDLQQALAALRDNGTRVGLSTSGPNQDRAIRAATDLEVDGAPLFSSIQSTWNLLESSAGPALTEAHDRGYAIVVKECLANGRLAPGSDDTSAGVRVAREAAATVGLSIDQLAVAAAIAQPFSPRVLSGAVTVDHIESHVSGAQRTLSERLLETLAVSAEDPASYWASRSARAWS